MGIYYTDVLIIGAGAVGVALARELSRFAIEIMVVDRLNDVGGDASKSNSAIIHTGFDAPPNSLESTTVVRANPMFDKLCSDLDIPFRRVGAVLAAITEEEEKELPKIMARARANHIYDVNYLTASQVHKIEPSINPKVRAGLFIPGESIVDPFLLVVALAENAADNGVTFLTDCEVVDLKISKGGFRAESTRGDIKARFVVNAAGLAADQVSAFLGIKDFNVHPRRGQFQVIDRAAPLEVKHIILPVPTLISKGKLIAPTVHGNWLIGPTAEELEDPSSHNTTREGLEEIIAEARKLVPAIDPVWTISQYAGLRPVRTPGGYHLRTFTKLPGYLELSGIRSTGITASLSVARIAVQKLSEMGNPSKPKINYIEKRTGIPCFRDSNNRRKEKFIRRNPLYGHVLCRCETVTEAEVVQAIHRNPGARDLDGIKRRVRAGLGRCQAGFCGMQIPQILSRELGVSMEKISKKGSGSEMFIGKTKSLRKKR